MRPAQHSPNEAEEIADLVHVELGLLEGSEVATFLGLAPEAQVGEALLHPGAVTAGRSLWESGVTPEGAPVDRPAEIATYRSCQI